MPRGPAGRGGSWREPPKGAALAIERESRLRRIPRSPGRRRAGQKQGSLRGPYRAVESARFRERRRQHVQRISVAAARGEAGRLREATGLASASDARFGIRGEDPPTLLFHLPPAGL